MSPDLGNRMKNYEAFETCRRVDGSRPVYVRLDGRSFSTFTSGMTKPFDQRMTEAMNETTKYMVQKTNSVIGYVQSDEISLMITPTTDTSQLMFGGKVHKMVSVFASMATAKLNACIRGWDGYEDRLPCFDARVMNLPDRMEAVNMLRWRYMDCTRNAIQSIAQSMFDHGELQGIQTVDLIEKIRMAGVDPYSFPSRSMYGSFVRSEKEYKSLTPAELAHIPEHKRPTGPFLRSVLKVYSTDMFIQLVNPVEVIFDNAVPIINKS